MPEKITGRTHGDAQLISEESFFELSPSDRDIFFPLLEEITEKVGIKFEITRDDGELEQAVLAVKQKFLVAYSNGCHRPVRATVEFLAEYQSEHAIADMTELTAALKQSAEADGAANLLFQLLCERASRELKNELLAHEAWTTLDDQEPEHLPASITGQNGVGGFGLANERAYFSIIKPLTEFIQKPIDEATLPPELYRRVFSWLDEVTSGMTVLNSAVVWLAQGLLLEQKDRFYQVITFFDQTAPKSDSLDQLCKQTAKFLKAFS